MSELNPCRLLRGCHGQIPSEAAEGEAAQCPLQCPLQGSLLHELAPSQEAHETLTR